MRMLMIIAIAITTTITATIITRAPFFSLHPSSSSSLTSFPNQSIYFYIPNL